MVNTERSASTSNSAVADSEKGVSTKLTRSYKTVAAMSTAACQNSTGPSSTYRSVITQGYREGPVSVREVECNTMFHDLRSHISYEAGSMIISGLENKRDRLHGTLRILEKQGGRGPLGHVDFTSLKQIFSGKQLPSSRYSSPGSQCISFPLRSPQRVFPQPQQELGKLSAVNCIRLSGAAKGAAITFQYVDNWVLDNSVVDVAYGILAGSGWDSVADAYAALLSRLSECLGSDFHDSVAVIVSMRWVPQDRKWTKGAAGRESVPILGSLEGHEQFCFKLVLRDSKRYSEVRSIVLDPTAGVTLLQIGPHIIAWASNLDQAQGFAKHRRMSKVVVQHVQVDSRQYSGACVRRALEKLELRLPGPHDRPVLLSYIVYKTEMYHINHCGMFQPILSSRIKIVPAALTPLGEAHIIERLYRTVPPTAEIKLSLSGTPVHKIISELQGPGWCDDSVICEPLSWEDYALMVVSKRIPSTQCLNVQLSAEAAACTNDEIQARLDCLRDEVRRLSALLYENISAGVAGVKKSTKEYSKAASERISTAPLKVGDQDTKPAAAVEELRKYDKEFPLLNSTTDSKLSEAIKQPDKPTSAEFSAPNPIKLDKGFFSMENGKKFFSSAPAKSKAPRKASDHSSKVAVQQSEPVPAAEPRKHLKWDDDGKELPPFSAEADTSQVATLTASSEAEVQERQESSNISTHSVCQESPTTESSPVKSPLLGQLTSKTSVPTLGSGLCRGSSSSAKFNDTMFEPLPLTTYNDIVTSFTNPTLIAVAEIIRIEVREHFHRPLRGVSILESNLNWKDCGVEKLRWILKHIKSDDMLMLQAEIFNVLNASNICGKLKWSKAMGHEYCTFGLIDKLPTSIEIPSAKLSRLIKEKDEENKYAAYLSSLTELDCAAAYYFYSGQLYDSPGIRLDGSFESRVETLRKSSDPSSTEEALLRIRPAFNQLYNKRKKLLGRLVSSSSSDWHAYQHPDGCVFELPAGTKILPDEIFRLLQRCQKKDSKVAADKSLDYPDAED